MSRITHDICDTLNLPHHRVAAIEVNSSKPDRRTMVIAGGAGYLGKLLGRYFSQRGWKIVVLTRQPRPSGIPQVRFVKWDGRTVGAWKDELEHADVLVNLAGRSVNCRYHDRNRREMMDSRTDSTRALGRAIGQCLHPPKLWLQSSTATIYEHTFGPAWDETGKVGWKPEAKDRFSIEVATEWERALDACPTPGTRKVKLRSAMVLGREPDANNAFVPLKRLAQLGLGGPMGNGLQYVSWIHETDFCRALEFLIDHPKLEDVVNIAAPNPLTNAEMMRTLRRSVGMPFGLPAASWMLEVGAFVLRTETELLIKSRRVIPGKLEGAGFLFQFNQFHQAVDDLVSHGKTNVTVSIGGRHERNEHEPRRFDGNRPTLRSGYQ